MDFVSGSVNLSYLQAGVHLTEKLIANAQKELVYMKFNGLHRIKLDDDLALGLNYAFKPSLVLKTEHHWNEGGLHLESPPALPLPPALPETRYWLVSLSTSF